MSKYTAKDHVGRVLSIVLVLAVMGGLMFFARAMFKGGEPNWTAQEGAIFDLRNELLEQANRFVSQIHADAPEKAYQELSQPYRDSVSAERFSESVRANAMLKQGESVYFQNFTENLGGASAFGEGLLESAGGTSSVRFDFVRRGEDTWEIGGVSVVGTPVLPTP